MTAFVLVGILVVLVPTWVLTWALCRMSAIQDQRELGMRSDEYEYWRARQERGGGERE